MKRPQRSFIIDSQATFDVYLVFPIFLAIVTSLLASMMMRGNRDGSRLKLLGSTSTSTGRAPQASTARKLPALHVNQETSSGRPQNDEVEILHAGLRPSAFIDGHETQAARLQIRLERRLVGIAAVHGSRLPLAA